MHQNPCNSEVLTGDGPRGPTGWSAEQRVPLQRLSEGWEWHLYFLNRETNKNHRFVLKRSDGGYPDPSAAGENEALGLALERTIDLRTRTRTDRGEAIKVLTLAEMVRRFLEREDRRINKRPHEGITPARFRLIRNQCGHVLDYCTGGRGGTKKTSSSCAQRVPGCVPALEGRTDQCSG